MREEAYVLIPHVSVAQALSMSQKRVSATEPICSKKRNTRGRARVLRCTYGSRIESIYGNYYYTAEGATAAPRSSSLSSIANSTAPGWPPLLHSHHHGRKRAAPLL